VKGAHGWEHEAKVHIGVRATVLEGQTPVAIGQSNLIVVNYDILPYWLEEIKKIRPQSIIGDECQNLTNPNAARTVAFTELCRGVPYVGGTSGSPFMNRPFEMYPMLKILRPDVFPSAWEFGWKYCVATFKRGEWSFLKSQNEAELNRLLLDTVMIRRQRDSRVKRRIINVPIDDYGQYHFAANDFMGWLRTKNSIKARRAARAEAYTRVNYLRVLVGQLKRRAVLEKINGFLENTDKKLVVYAFHRGMVDSLRRGIVCPTTSIIGGLAKQAREDAVYRFQRDPAVRCQVNNIHAGGVGLNGLQLVSHHVAFAETAWRPKDHEQAECRLDRIGQTEDTVHSTWLIAGNTIEARICEILQNKGDTFAKIIDGQDNGDPDMDVFDMLIEVLAKENK
jgi:SWI/SNF-related matrix-associated actin-dependent regulator 1 of chromatin subfamily A